MPFEPSRYRTAIDDLSLTFNNYVDNYNDETNVVDGTIIFPGGCRGSITVCKQAIDIQKKFINQYKSVLKTLKELLTDDFGVLFNNVENNDNNITDYKNDNITLQQDYLELQRSVNGASGQYNDIQLRHNQLYYANILILSCIIGGTVFYSGTRKL
tara:strand:+ start:6808 stop:7275 length:468 start_codon:yes stop_codon:yes gene_type:complete